MFKKFFRDNSLHKKIISFSLFDYVFLYKPIYLMGPVSIVLSGMYLASFSNSNLNLGITLFNLKTSLFMLGLSLIISCVFIKNEIKSKPENLKIRLNFIGQNLVGDSISINSAKIIHNCSLLIGFSLILFTDWINIFIFLSIYYLWVYSIETSASLIKKIFFNFIISFLLIFAGWSYSGYSFNSIILFFLLSLPYTCLFLGIIILIEMPQKIFTSTISMFLTLIGLMIAYYNNDPLGTTSLSVSFPFYLFLVLRGREKDLIRSIRYPIFLLNFFIFTIYPLSMIPMVIIYYFSKYYYWHRFDTHFPALAINDDYN